VSSLLDHVMVRAPRRRNAAAAASGIPNPHQTWLAAEKRALLRRWGAWENPDPNGKAVPYLTPMDVARLLGIVEEAAQAALALAIPEAAKQPGYVRQRLLVMRGAIAYEPAPLGSKVPGLVVKHAETVAFLAAAQGIAQHADALRVQPTNWNILVQSIAESVEELPERVASVVGGAAGLAAKAGAPLWPLVAVGAVGLITLGVLASRR
jgi:hypothetical protein